MKGTEGAQGKGEGSERTSEDFLKGKIKRKGRTCQERLGYRKTEKVWIRYG